MENGKRNPTLEEVRIQWEKRIDDIEPVYCYIVLLGGKPIAYIQWYLVEDFPDAKILNPESAYVAGIDVFIGEKDYLYKGFGPVLIRKFIKEFIFENQDIQSCLIDPEPENKAAIRAYEKIGFKYIHTIYEPKYDCYAYVMTLSRNDFNMSSD